jgi:hypothetical protein
MKFVEPSQFADPDVAARKLVEIANGIEAVQEGRIYIGRSTARSSELAARQTSIALLWPTRSPRAGCGCTSPGLM